MAAVVMVAVVVLVVGSPSTPTAASGVQNVVVVMVDDMAFTDMIALSETESLLGDSGVTFTNSFVNTSNCCPSRATWITGQRSSNHGVTSTKWDLADGSPNPDSYIGLDHENTLPVWLRAAGFETIFVGKYLNGYGKVNLDGVDGNSKQEVPPGWTDFHAFPGEKTWTNFELSENGVVNEYTGPDEHQTDVLARISREAVTRSVAAGKPFYMWVAPFAPHTQGGGGDEGDETVSGNPPEPPIRHEHAFDDVALPTPPNFNEKGTNQPNFVSRQPKLTGPQLRDLRNLHEGRLESLRAVDDLMVDMIDHLKAQGVYDSTMIVFTSDNGYMLGNHRLEGKIRVYDESIRVPLLISGGPFSGGVTSDVMVSNIDLVPTITKLLGITPGVAADGVDLSSAVSRPGLYADRALIIESDGGPGYRAVRSAGWAYVDYVGSAEELYDMVNDPYQLVSLHRQAATAGVRDAYVTLLDRLGECVGAECALDTSGSPLGIVGGSTTTVSPTTTTAPTTTTLATTSSTPTTTTSPPPTSTPTSSTPTSSTPTSSTPTSSTPTSSTTTTTTTTTTATTTTQPTTTATTAVLRVDGRPSNRSLAPATRLSTQVTTGGPPNRFVS